MKRLLIFSLIGLVLLCGAGSFVMKGFKPPAAKVDPADTTTVQKGDLDLEVIETGTINSKNVVEVKSFVGGRIKQLLVDEGDHVKTGQLIAIVDPQETQLLYEQNQAQLQGAESAVGKASVDIEERKLTAQSDLEAAQARLLQARQEMKAQPALTKAAIDQQKTALESAQQEKQRLILSYQPGQRMSSKEAVGEARVNLSNAEREYKRNNDLLAKGYVSQKVVDDAKLALDLAKVRLEKAEDDESKLEDGLRADINKQDQAIMQAKAALENAEANSAQIAIKKAAYDSALADVAKYKASLRDVDSLAMQKKQSEATVSQFKSVVGDAERQLRETQVKSPIDGVVTKREVQVGELVSSLGSFSSGTQILRIEDRRSMKVELDVNEIDAARMHLGMEAKVDVDALPGRPFKGTVTKIAPSSTAMDSTSSTTTSTSTSDNVVKFKVEILINDPNQQLSSGMSAKCTLRVLHHPNVVLVPSQFLGSDKDGSFVMIAPSTPKGTATKQVVKIGTDNGSMTEVVSGLSSGQQLVKPTYGGPPRKGAMSGPD